MAAKDYQICTSIFNAYIAKVSKRIPILMTNDRREITEEEILALIDWYLDKEVDEGERALAFDSCAREGMQIIMKFKKKDK